MNQSYFHNIGKFLKSLFVAAATAVAAGTGDNTEATGANLARSGYLSGKLVISWTTTLTDTKTLSFTVKSRTGTSSSACTSASQVTELAKTVVATSSGGGTMTGTTEVNIDLGSYDQYVAFDITPDLSHSGTDTAVWAAAFVMGGADTLPAA